MRKVFTLSSLFALFILFISNFASADVFPNRAKPISKTAARSVQRELDYWADRRAENGLVVLNTFEKLPVADVAQTEAYLRAMVEKLAGAEIREKKINLIITIVNGEQPNAYMRRHSPMKRMPKTKREAYEANLSRMTFGVQKLIGINEPEVVYELAVSTGLFGLMKTEAEIAFVIGHELTHLFEGHVENPEPGESVAKRWWGAQRHELIADSLGIKRMVGHYQLNAALVALTKLATLNEDADMHAVFALAGSHHHEGVRISAAQATIEGHLRKNVKAQLFNDRDLPAFVNIAEIPPQVQFSTSFEAAKPAYLKKARDYYFGDLPILFGSDEREAKPFEGELMEVMSAHDPGTAQISDLFAATVDLIATAPGKSSQEKVDAYVKAATEYKKLESFDDKYFKSLSAEALAKIESFLLQETLSAEPWNPDLFDQKINTLVKDHRNRAQYRYYVRNALIRGVKQQEMYVRLMKAAKPWDVYLDRKVAEPITNLDSYTDQLGALIRELATGGSMRDDIHPVINAAMQEKLIAQLKTIDLSELARRVSTDKLDVGEMVFKKTLETLKYSEKDEDIYERKVDQEFVKRVRDVLSTVIAIFADTRFDLAKRMLKSKTYSKYLTKNVLDTVFGSIDAVAMKDGEWKELRALLPKFCASQNRKFTIENDLDHKHLRLMLSEILLSSDFTAEEKSEAYRFLLGTTKSSRYEFSEELDAFKQNMSRVFSAALAPAVLGHLNARNSSVEDEIVAVFKAKAKYPGTFEQLPAALAKLGEDAFHVLKWQESTAVRERLNFLIGSRVTALSIIAQEPKLRESFVGETSRADFERIVAGIDDVRAREGAISDAMEVLTGFSLDHHAVAMLFDLFIKYQGEFTTVDAWLKVFESIDRLNKIGIEQKHEFKPALEKRLRELIDKENTSTYQNLLERPSIWRVLGSDYSADMIVKSLESQIAAGAPETERLTRTNDFVAKLKLKDEYPDVYVAFRNKWSEKQRVQPTRLEGYFPNDERSLTEQSDAMSTYVRGLSAMVAQTRKGTMEEQIGVVEYLMGYRERVPAYVLKLGVRVEEHYGTEVMLSGLLSQARERLMRESRIVRTVVANSFLAGPNSFLGKPDGREYMLEYFLKNVRAENKEIARLIGEAVLYAQGDSTSLAFAYAMANQPGELSDVKEREANILNSLFTAFGVPGVKMGQYLAFTSQMKEYQTALESLQDSAMPISYYEAIRLIKLRFGNGWIERYKIERILGSGSANIAVKFVDTKSGETGVASIAREDIEISLNEDFRKFNLALDYVMKHPKHGSKFEFLRGLSTLIETSVKLEFNKVRVHEMQKAAEKLYRHRVGDWRVVTVQGIGTGPGTVFMSEGKGRSARKVLNEKPEVYKSALRSLNHVEFEGLMGRTPDGSKGEHMYLANPDFHDGQVLIDADNKTVTILDFGQAVPINDAERARGVDVLAIITGAQSTVSTVKEINQWLNDAKSKKSVTEAEVKDITQSGDRMDIFIKLISLTSRRGYDLPIATVHWVLAANRIITLGKKIDVDNESALGKLVMARQVGVSAERYSGWRAWLQAARGYFGGGEMVEALPPAEPRAAIEMGQ